MESQQTRKQGIVHTYELASGGYDGRWLPFWRAAAHGLVELAGLSPGQAVLDAGTGTGEAALAAAEAVGPTGRVLGIDLSPAMLARAADKAEGRALGYVSFMRHDLERVEELDQRFDAVLSSNSLFFADDMRAALRGFATRLSPKGVIAVGVPGGRALQPQSDATVKVLRNYPVKIPDRFSWQRIPDAPALATLLSSSGLADVRTETQQYDYRLPEAAAWWDVVWGSGFRSVVAELTPADLERAQKEIIAGVAALGDAGLSVDYQMHFAVGRLRG